MCPWNLRFAKELPNDSAYAPREVLASKDARTLAREVLGMTQAEFSRAFKGSPMKRAKLRGLRRNAAVVMGNVGSPDDVPALAAALSDDEPLVRSHAAWALGRLGSPAAAAALRERLEVEADAGGARGCARSWRRRSTPCARRPLPRAERRGSARSAAARSARSPARSGCSCSCVPPDRGSGSPGRRERGVRPCAPSPLDSYRIAPHFPLDVDRNTSHSPEPP